MAIMTLGNTADTHSNHQALSTDVENQLLNGEESLGNVQTTIAQVGEFLVSLYSDRQTFGKTKDADLSSADKYARIEELIDQTRELDSALHNERDGDNPSVEYGERIPDIVFTPGVMGNSYITLMEKLGSSDFGPEIDYDSIQIRNTLLENTRKGTVTAEFKLPDCIVTVRIYQFKATGVTQPKLFMAVHIDPWKNSTQNHADCRLAKKMSVGRYKPGGKVTARDVIEESRR